MKRKQWRWQPRGWNVMLTVEGHSWGFGFVVVRYNGPDIFLGPLVLTIQPPAPKWLSE